MSDMIAQYQKELANDLSNLSNQIGTTPNPIAFVRRLMVNPESKSEKDSISVKHNYGNSDGRGF